MTLKIRMKYTISLLILGIVIYWNWKGIVIQDNFVSTVKWIVGTIFGGFAIKKIKEAVIEKFK